MSTAAILQKYLKGWRLSRIRDFILILFSALIYNDAIPTQKPFCDILLFLHRKEYSKLSAVLLELK
jgi:hypothetical protein